MIRFQCPDGWNEFQLKDVADVITGTTPSTAVPEYYGGSVPFVTPGDLGQVDTIVSAKSTLSESGLTQVRLLPPNAVMVCCIGSLGKTGIAGTEVATNQQINSLVFDERRVFPRYGYHFCRTLSPLLEHIAPSTTVAIVNKGNFGEIVIPLPPLPEQRRIAAILDQADAIRRKRQKAIELTETFLKSAFLEMFGDPVTNPKGWPQIPFADAVVNRDSKRIPLKQSDRDARHGEFPYYGSVGIIDYVDDFIYEGEHLLISEDGKHLFTRNRPIAQIADGKFWVNNHAHVLASNQNVDLWFLADYMEMIPITQFVTGIDQFKLNRSSLDRIPVILPPVALQQAYRELVDRVNQMTQTSRLSSSASDTLFDSLVQRAFRGELSPVQVL